MISQRLDSVPELDQFIAGMMDLSISVSGAEHAVLLLREGPDWFIRAHRDSGIRKDGVLLDELFDPAAGNAGDVPVPGSIFNHCLRSGEILVIGDARSDDRSSGDRTVKARGIRSLACMPISVRGETGAVLYLEDFNITDVFTPDRVETLERLSFLCASYIERARLCEKLDMEVRECRKYVELYGLASAGSAAGIWDWDISSGMVHLSDHLQDLLGYPPGELKGSEDELWDLIHPDDLEVVRLAVDRHLRERTAFMNDLRLRTGTGEYRWFHMRGQAQWDDQGNAVRMAGSLADVSAKKEVDERLAASEERFRNMMEQSPLAMEILSPEGQVIRYNKAWLKLWGVTEEEAAKVIAHYNMITDPQVIDFGIQPLVKRAFSGEALVLPPIQYDGDKLAEDFDVKLSGPNTNWIQCHLFSIKDKSGKIVNVVNTYMDITELKLVEQESRENREALARIDRAASMGQLTGAISHELNQPLTGILSNAQAAELLLAREDLDRDELVDIVSSIIADTKRAGDLIRNLREVYREQKGKFLPENINEIVEETAALMNSEFIMQDAAISLECAPSMPTVSGNKVQIQQVLVNILMNGLQAMSGNEKKDRWIRIGTVWEGNEVKVLIEDNGPGIDADKIDRIFEPLSTWKPGGTGMGLAISNTIVKAHGGRMFAENRPGGGARIGFDIPVMEEEKAHE